MTGNRNGSGPAGDIGLDAGGHNGGAENGAVQNAADGAVGALVHLLQIVLGHALGVGGDGGALDANMILLDGVAGIPGNLVVGCVTVDQTQVVVFGVELDKRIQKLVLDHGPKDSGHFVAVHLNDGVLHFDLFHHKFSFYFRRLEACCQRQVYQVLSEKASGNLHNSYVCFLVKRTRTRRAEAGVGFLRCGSAFSRARRACPQPPGCPGRGSQPADRRSRRGKGFVR